MTKDQKFEKETWDFIQRVESWPLPSQATAVTVLGSVIAERLGMTDREFFESVIGIAEGVDQYPDAVH